MVSQLSKILISSPFHAYCNAIAAVREKYKGPYRSWMGVNYGPNKLTYKFYFTFFEKVTGPEVQALLKDYYAAYLDKLKEIDEAIALDFYTPGSGITFTIKFDASTDATAQGFFFRTKSLADTTVFYNFIKDFNIENAAPAAFNTSPGYYFMRNSETVSEKTYAYITDNSVKLQLGKLWPLAASADCVEVGLDTTNDKQGRIAGAKLILLGNYQNTILQFLSETTNPELTTLCTKLKTLGIQALCPGKYLIPNVQSLYFFAPVQQQPVLTMDTIETLRLC